MLWKWARIATVGSTARRVRVYRWCAVNRSEMVKRNLLKSLRRVMHACSQSYSPFTAICTCIYTYIFTNIYLFLFIIHICEYVRIYISDFSFAGWCVIPFHVWHIYAHYYSHIEVRMHMYLHIRIYLVIVETCVIYQHSHERIREYRTCICFTPPHDSFSITALHYQINILAFSCFDVPSLLLLLTRLIARQSDERVSSFVLLKLQLN